MLKKCSYHQLTDGWYLAWAISAYETLAEMAHMLQLTMGTVELPVFGAPYVEKLIDLLE